MPWFDHSRRRTATACVLTALLLTAASCGDDGEASPASTTTTEAATSTTGSTTSTTSSTASTTEGTTATTAPGTTPEQEVIDRYVGYWNARFTANEGTPDPNDPALREFATGEQLDAVIAETQTNLDEGLAFQRPAEPHNIQRITVIEIEGDHAVVQECVVSDGVIVRRDTGEVVNDEVNTHNVQAELTRVDGVWKVSSARLLQRFEGVSGCALAS